MDEGLEADFDIVTEPSLTYMMHVDANDGRDSRFLGKTDGTEAVKQAVLKILNTERYGYEIYTWDYGVELQDLYGQPMSYVLSELEDRVTEALVADDRIESVEGFNAERTSKRTVYCSFTVITTEGDAIGIGKEVQV